MANVRRSIHGMPGAQHAIPAFEAASLGPLASGLSETPALDHGHPALLPLCGAPFHDLSSSLGHVDHSSASAYSDMASHDQVSPDLAHFSNAAHSSYLSSYMPVQYHTMPSLDSSLYHHQSPYQTTSNLHQTPQPAYNKISLQNRYPPPATPIALSNPFYGMSDIGQVHDGINSATHGHSDSIEQMFPPTNWAHDHVVPRFRPSNHTDISDNHHRLVPSLPMGVFGTPSDMPADQRSEGRSATPSTPSSVSTLSVLSSGSSTSPCATPDGTGAQHMLIDSPSEYMVTSPFVGAPPLDVHPRHLSPHFMQYAPVPTLPHASSSPAMMNQPMMRMESLPQFSHGSASAPSLHYHGGSLYRPAFVGGAEPSNIPHASPSVTALPALQHLQIGAAASPVNAPSATALEEWVTYPLGIDPCAPKANPDDAHDASIVASYSDYYSASVSSGFSPTNPDDLVEDHSPHPAQHYPLLPSIDVAHAIMAEGSDSSNPGDLGALSPISSSSSSCRPASDCDYDDSVPASPSSRSTPRSTPRSLSVSSGGASEPGAIRTALVQSAVDMQQRLIMRAGPCVSPKIRKKESTRKRSGTLERAVTVAPMTPLDNAIESKRRNSRPDSPRSTSSESSLPSRSSSPPPPGIVEYEHNGVNYEVSTKQYARLIKMQERRAKSAGTRSAIAQPVQSRTAAASKRTRSAGKFQKETPRTSE